MKRTMSILLLILLSAVMSTAATYKWTDDQGTVNFSDDRASIPVRYRAKAQKIKDNTKAQQKLGNQGQKNGHGQITSNRAVKTLVSVPPASTTPDIQQTIKGHLGGDQIDPAPPSMKQPIPAPLGDQPKATSPGMKQPKPEPVGDQPKATPAGMKQPKPEPIGDQPTPSPIGMEQPTPKQ